MAFASEIITGICVAAFFALAGAIYAAISSWYLDYLHPERVNLTATWDVFEDGTQVGTCVTSLRFRRLSMRLRRTANSNGTIDPVHFEYRAAVTDRQIVGTFRQVGEGKIHFVGSVVGRVSVGYDEIDLRSMYFKHQTNEIRDTRLQLVREKKDS